MRVLVSAGEPSGDRHAAAVARALREQTPTCDIEAVGGPALAGAGVRILEGLGRLSAMGLVEAAGSLLAHVRLLRRLDRRLADGRYDLLVLVDYPGFHLRLAQRAVKRGVPVLYYIAPQVWAWGAWRVPLLRRSVRHLAVILPFEEAFFRGHGIATSFVGHPLLEQPVVPDRRTARAMLGIADGTPVLALFPGSRPKDIAYHSPVFHDAARRVRAMVPGVEVLVAGSGAGHDGLRFERDPAMVRAAADAAIVKSGTATLEAALAGLPMVVAYRMHPVTHHVARRVVRVPHVGLVNLVARAPVVPELIQTAATGPRLAAAVVALLEPGGRAAQRQQDAFQLIRERLGEPGAAGRVAALALECAA